MNHRIKSSFCALISIIHRYFILCLVRTHSHSAFAHSTESVNSLETYKICKLSEKNGTNKWWQMNEESIPMLCPVSLSRSLSLSNCEPTKECCSRQKVKKKNKLWIQNTELKSLQLKSYIMQISSKRWEWRRRAKNMRLPPKFPRYQTRIPFKQEQFSSHSFFSPRRSLTKPCIYSYAFDSIPQIHKLKARKWNMKFRLKNYGFRSCHSWSMLNEEPTSITDTYILLHIMDWEREWVRKSEKKK